MQSQTYRAERHLSLVSDSTNGVVQRTNLRSLRTAQGWTQTELAGRLLDVSPAEIRRYEAGRESIPRPLAGRAAELFGVSVAHLLGRD